MIMRFLKKIPAGMMVVPMLLGAIINTFLPEVTNIGSFTTAVFTSAGANTAIGIQLFCLGTTLRVPGYERNLCVNIGTFAKKYHLCSMNWIEQVTILDLLVKGLIVGVVVSAPLGPVGVLCIQRTLNKGRWYGFVTGLGAALSDIGYALITGYGMSFMDEFLAKNQVLLQIVGSVMLLMFGIYTFRSNPVHSIRPVSSTPGSYLHNFVTAFFVTFSNPLIIFLFIGLFARFSFVMPGSPLGLQLVGYLAIVLGALLWWFGITYFVNKVRTRFNLRGIWILNRVIGVIVMLMSVVGFIYTILKADCKVEEVDSFYTVLKRTEMLTVNVEELNYLAKRLDSFDTGEAAQFQAMAHRLELFELKNLINLTFCCQQATVITDFSDLAAIGRDHL